MVRYTRKDKHGNMALFLEGDMMMASGFDDTRFIGVPINVFAAYEDTKLTPEEITQLKTRCAALEAALSELKACSTCKFRSFPEESNVCDKCLNGLKDYYEFDLERYVKKGETE